jgi:hypothetical protein
MCPDKAHLDSSRVPADRRRHQRRRSLLSGKIVLVNGVAYDCAIHDVSDGGAQVRLTSPAALPDTFRLIDVSRGLGFSATVIWRNLPSVGLQLTEPLDLTKSDSPADLHRLWLECAPR